MERLPMQFVLFIVAVACCRCIEAESTLLDAAKESEPWLIAKRRELHRIPELRFDLPKTSAVVRETLDAYNIPYTYPVAESGIVATIGSGTDRIVALRADMDALPITEDTGLNFSSEHDGRMHACGHDAHTTMLLGAARLLKEREESLGGTVKLVFQPAEEVGRGARAMLKTGLLDDVMMMFGFHVWPNVKSGDVVTRSGVFMAGVNMFSVTVRGKGGHASMPHLTIDPHVTVASMILAYQTLISRKANPLDTNVITVTQVRGGEAYNVIPDIVTFGGTMRSLQPGGIETLEEQFIDMTHKVAAMYHCTATIDIPLKGDPVINHPYSTAFAQEMARKMFGEDHVIEGDPSTGAEDFAYFGQKIPATFLFLGIHNESLGTTALLHTPQFDIDESVLHRGAALHAALAIEYLDRTASAPKTEL